MAVKNRVNIRSRSATPARGAPGGSGTEQLRFRLRAQFRWNRADETRLQAKLQKNAANFAESDRRFVQLEIDDVVVAIDLVAQTRHRLELMIEFENFVQVAHAGRINFKFDHDCAGKCNGKLAR